MVLTKVRREVKANSSGGTQGFGERAVGRAAAGEVPEQPRVDGAERELSALGGEAAVEFLLTAQIGDRRIESATLFTTQVDFSHAGDLAVFVDEAQVAIKLQHVNVAQVFEVGQEHGIHYLAMEYVHGQDMRGLLAREFANYLRTTGPVRKRGSFRGAATIAASALIA